MLRNILPLALIIVTLGGCSVTRPEYSITGVEKIISSPVYVLDTERSKVIGELTHPEMAQMMIDSINKALLDSNITANSSLPDISVDVEVIRLHTPEWGVRFGTKADIYYTVISGEKVIFEEEINTEGFSSFGHSAVGLNRHTDAINLAIQQNIKEFVQKFCDSIKNDGNK